MKRFLLIAIAVVMVFSLTACGDGNKNKPPEGYDKEFTIYINGSDEWTPFAGKSGVSFTVSDDKVISVSDDGTKVEFTGKQIGESVITATLDGVECKAEVEVRIAEASQEKHYVTYSEPIKAYYYERVVVNDRETEIIGYYDKNMLWTARQYNFVNSNGDLLERGFNGSEWKIPADTKEWDDWAEGDCDYIGREWPLSEFAAYIANYDEELDLQGSNYSLPEMYVTCPEKLPNHRDATKFYVRSEKVNDTLCDVYEDFIFGLQKTFTWWVDPATGLTLKYQERDKEGTLKSGWEIIRLIIGDANFAEYGLGDVIKN